MSDLVDLVSRAVVHVGVRELLGGHPALLAVLGPLAMLALLLLRRRRRP